MSRNSETIFTSLPSINIQRSIMDIPQDTKTTFNTGELIPFYISECLPSDSVKIRTNKVVRLQTLLTPLMDNLYLDTYYFFVPNRLVWTHWKEFMGENTASAYLPEVTYRPPQIKAGTSSYGAISSGDILDYMGLPLVTAEQTLAINPIALPLRGYWLIWNEFFRDENLQDPVNIPMGDSDVEWKDVTSSLKKPLPVNRLHDYFSSALKAPAKTANGFVSAFTSQQRATTGNPYVTAYGLDAAHMLPVKTGSVALSTNVSTDYALHGNVNIPGDDPYSQRSRLYGLNFGDSTSESAMLAKVAGNLSHTGFVPSNLYADVHYNQFGITIPDLRQAFQMQKFLEREASHGSRYQETLLAHFTVRAQDARLQRPEYLGGNRVPLNVIQVVNQTQASGEYLGDVGAMSLTSDSHFDVEFSIQEHGYIFGLCCVRYKNSYSQGFDRMWYKSTRFDYAWPEFAHLTDQPIRNWEIYAVNTTGDYANAIFGYQERYAEYKYKPNKVTGEMRPGISNSLASWHLGDYYTDSVYLSDEWLRVSKNPVDRAVAVTSAVSNQFFGDFYVEARWTRPLPVHSNPGFADHF